MMMLCKPQIEFNFYEKSLQNDESIFSGRFIDPSWQVCSGVQAISNLPVPKQSTED